MIENGMINDNSNTLETGIDFNLNQLGKILSCRKEFNTRLAVHRIVIRTPENQVRD